MAHSRLWHTVKRIPGSPYAHPHAMTSTDFLIIEPFLHDAIQARTLQAAFELGIIDALESNACLPESQVLRGRSCDSAGGRFLLQVLARSGVVQLNEKSVPRKLCPGCLRF
jgi:hypothetical protein